METKFNFKSQPCTSKEQSERLLALGLKKETSDMGFREFGNGWKEYFIDGDVYNLSSSKIFPAWSLHRLIELAYGNWKEDIAPVYLGNSYDMLIGRIEFQVKQGKFNKEYLEE